MASAMPSYSLSNGTSAPTVSSLLSRRALLTVDSMERSPTEEWRPSNMPKRLIPRNVSWNRPNS